MPAPAKRLLPAVLFPDQSRPAALLPWGFVRRRARLVVRSGCFLYTLSALAWCGGVRGGHGVSRRWPRSVRACRALSGCCCARALLDRRAVAAAMAEGAKDRRTRGQGGAGIRIQTCAAAGRLGAL